MEAELNKFILNSEMAELISTKFHFAKYIMWLLQEHTQRVDFLKGQLSGLKTDICDLILREKGHTNFIKEIQIHAGEGSSKSKIYDNCNDPEKKKAFEKECKKFSKSINKALVTSGDISPSKHLKPISECSNSSEKYLNVSRPSSRKMPSSEKSRKATPVSSRTSSASKLDTMKHDTSSSTTLKNSVSDIRRRCPFKDQNTSGHTRIRKSKSAVCGMTREKSEMIGKYNKLMSEMCSVFGKTCSSVSQKDVRPSKVKNMAKVYACRKQSIKVEEKRSGRRKNAEKGKNEDVLTLESFLDFINTSPHLTVEAVYAPLNKMDNEEIKGEQAKGVSDFAISWPRYIKFNLKNNLETLQENQETTSFSGTETEIELPSKQGLRRRKNIDYGFTSDATSYEA
ncbi:uncharacterized protein LOC108738611 isoform X2 [Agrilus planipennis]|uniref:Uncharacterized protein LOC108738611 isoform X2 n=1 Tax=Agrilus planipennis TaxID=224129 RepID=A0A1W4X469_AGRPL|nr:uncharacterized protein LOC108738611 isoform X2 [Agrilus planipennis]